MEAFSQLGALTTALILSISFFGSFITGAFGIGGGIVTLAGIASLLPAAAVIPVHGAVQIGSNAGRFAIMRNNFNAQALFPFFLGALVGVGLGGAFVVSLDPSTLRITLGLFILWAVFFKPPQLLAKSAGLVGAISSFLTMFVGGTGPFVITFVKSLNLDRLGTVATNAGFMTLQHSLKTVVFLMLGFAFSEWLLLILAMIVAGFAGTLLGKTVLLRINEAIFRTVLNVILVVLALRLISIGISPWIMSSNG